MKEFLEEFRKFALRGNVIDLAVGVVIGAAFGKIVDSLVGDVLMPTIGIITGGIDFSGLSVSFGKASIAYGKFIQATIVFAIVAFALFSVIKVINKIKKKEEKQPVAPKTSAETELLKEIRDLLRNKNP